VVQKENNRVRFLTNLERFCCGGMECRKIEHPLAVTTQYPLYAAIAKRTIPIEENYCFP